IELALEGGVAYIPRLVGLRRINIATLSVSQRKRIAEIIRQSLPFVVPHGLKKSPGCGDQRFYRLEINRGVHQCTDNTDIVLLIPEDTAPAAVEELWRKGIK